TPESVKKLQKLIAVIHERRRPSPPEVSGGDSKGRPVYVPELISLPWTALALYNAQWFRPLNALEYLYFDQAMTYMTQDKIDALEKIFLSLEREGNTEQAEIARHLHQVYITVAATHSISVDAMNLSDVPTDSGGSEPRH
ncbi:MAG: hypothetical protein LBW85_03115, partial [Deltaproteobacteria bacterium]|nr:hypothetical protein [Deltaproteobacteria bacterium]